MRQDHGMIGGLAAGWARRWGLDPLFVRVLLVISALCRGVGIVAYVLLRIFGFGHKR